MPNENWTKRFAVSALVGFLVFVLALPISCCGFVIYNEHLYGDVESGGPQAILSAMALSAVLAILVGFVLMRKSRSK